MQKRILSLQTIRQSSLQILLQKKISSPKTSRHHKQFVTMNISLQKRNLVTTNNSSPQISRCKKEISSPQTSSSPQISRYKKKSSHQRHLVTTILVAKKKPNLVTKESRIPKTSSPKTSRHPKQFVTTNISLQKK